jgi:alpha-mannosidase
MQPSSRTSAPQTGETFWFIPHTHWEGAVFKTRQEYLEMGLPNILRALKILKEYPDYRFVLDQVCYVKPFLERYPQEEAAFRKMVADGRLQIVGGTDVMPDVNMPGGESFIRQVLYGKGYYRRKLGVDVTVGWQLDTFGHHAQMPQMLTLAGYKSFWFFRGVSGWDVPPEFLWEGLDGSRVPAFWLPEGYAVVYGSPKTPADFARFFRERYATLGRFSRGPDRVGLAGADVCEPEEHVPGLVREFNRTKAAPFTLRIGVPTDFEAAVARRTDRPVITGELNPIFQGTYSSRIVLKQWTRNNERLLITAEKLSALSRLLGAPTDEQAIWRAWEPTLFNHAHDLMSGVMTDRVYDDTVQGYAYSKRLADELVGKGLEDLCSKADTRGDGVALLVFNSLGWPRTDVTIADVGFSEGGITDLKLIDSAGQPIAVQTLTEQRCADGSLVQARIAFVVGDVPAMGYAVCRLIPLRTSGPSKACPTAAKGANVIENDRYRLTFDSATGAMTSLVVRPEKWEVLSSPANVVSREADHGDLWELYQSLDGGSRIAMKRKQPVPQPGKAVFSSEFRGESGTVLNGPVVSEFKVSHPFGKNGHFATSVRLYAGLPRIDIRTRILNQERFVRYQMLLPTSIRGGKSIHEIPFGAIARPSGIEFPSQNWVDYGDGQHGVALLNRGLPGNLVTDSTMMLSLMRSTRIVAYGFGGGYEPGMSSDSGFELGKELTFDYALVPHKGDWREAGVYRHGLEFNNPLIVRTVSSHAGTLPNRWGLLELSHSNVVVSTLKPGRDGTMVLRLYEASGQPVRDVTITMHAKLTAAEEVNLMEDPLRKLDIRNDTLRFDLRAYEIKTFKLSLQPAPNPKPQS